MYDHSETYGLPTSGFMLSRTSLAKVYTCDVAVMVTNKAMELVGSYSYMNEYNVEKYWQVRVNQLKENSGSIYIMTRRTCL